MWNRPVPVKKSSYTALFKEGKNFNIEVNLKAIGAFSSKKRIFENSELLFSDQQESVILNSAQIMGSGRSGFYKGSYVKGMGRTTLAGNWNDGDLLHSSGHLLPSAAIRELIVTHYLRAKGNGKSFVQCQGILLKPLSTELKTKAQNTHAAPIDFALQAITYKEDNFARASNLVWYLNQMGTLSGSSSSYPLQEFMTMLGLFLRPDRFIKQGQPDEKALERLDFKDVAKLYAQMLNRTIGYFSDHFQSGVHWGSFNNNYTLDGRFLDLEVPIFLGGPFVGGIQFTHGQDTQATEPVPRSEYFVPHFMRIMKDFALLTDYLNSRIKFLITHKAFTHSLEQDYAEAFLIQLNKDVKEHAPWVHSSAARVRIVDQMLKKRLRLKAADHHKLKSSLNYWAKQGTRYETKRKIPKFNMEKVDLSFSRAEAHVGMDIYTLEFFREKFSKQNQEEAEFINTLLIDLVQKKDVDQALFALTEAVSKIDRFLS